MKDAMMHVPLALRNSQNELKSAIHKHQFLLTKLKECPSNEDLQRQMEMIQKHIFSLGLMQKKLVQKLRKEMELRKAKSSEKKKQLKPPSAPSATKHSKQPNGHSFQDISSSPEEITLSATCATSAMSLTTERSVNAAESAATGDAPTVFASESVTPSTPVKSTTSATTPAHSAKRSPSLSPSFCAITDRVSKNRLTQPKGKLRKGSSSPSGSEASVDSTSEIKPFDAALNTKLEFMTSLGLVTREVMCELQNRKFERKRRSTAKPQFVYGNSSEQAAKKKKYISNGVQNNRNGVVAFTRLVAVPNSTCLVCSSAKGLLSVCWSCRRAFHWGCISDAPIPPASEGQLHCPSCRSSPKIISADTEGQESTPVGL